MYVWGFGTFAFLGLSFFSIALAHGDEAAGAMGGMTAGGTSSAMVTQMQGMMHGDLDKNKTVDCKTISDADMMKHGEGMMQEMMGTKEAHEKAEEAMTKEGHDNMHTMMGMWATGCVGDEAAGTLMGRYGAAPAAQNRSGSTGIVLGVIIGALIGVIISKFFFTKTV